MVRKILTYPEDIETLSLKSMKVQDINSQETKTIIQDLKDTLRETNGGKGMAAIQIGYPMQICICSWDGQELVMINPKITRTRGQQNFLEGCLSSPGIYVEVPRAQKVWCEYTDENGERKMIDKGGRMSNIIQHELDHFDGICKVHEAATEANYEGNKN